MAEELKKLQIRSKKNARIATGFLLGSMGIMALWGYTPLKAIIPAIQILGAFLGCLVLSVVFTGITLIQGIKVKHMKARNEDE